MQQYMQISIVAVCAVLLTYLVIATIVNKSFRDAILGGEGEAKVFGILSVRGVTIVILSGLLLGGMLYALQFDPSSRKYPIPIFGKENETLVEQIADEVGSTPEGTKKTIELFLGSIKSRLAAGEKVQLDGFGTFIVHSREARKGRNPATGEEINIRAAKVPDFIASKELTKFLNGDE